MQVVLLTTTLILIVIAEIKLWHQKDTPKIIFYCILMLCAYGLSVLQMTETTIFNPSVLIETIISALQNDNSEGLR